MLARWIRCFTFGTLKKTFIKAAGMFQRRTSLICGQLLVKHSLQIFLWFCMSRFPEFLEKEELNCNTGACMHWSNTVGKYIKAWWYTSLGCVTALNPVHHQLLSGSTLQLCHGATDTPGSRTVIQSAACSAPWLFWSSCCSAPAPCLLQRKALPACLAQGSAPWGNTHKDGGTMLEVRSQSKKMYVYAKCLTKFTCKSLSTYQRFQTSYLLLGLAQLLENMV